MRALRHSRGQLVKHRHTNRLISCLLMHVGAAQACARLQERQRVRPAAHGGRFHPAQQHVSTVPQVKYRGLGR